MKEPQPEHFQTENHVIDDGYYWSHQGRATWDQLLTAVDNVEGPLWDNDSSSYNGRHDRVDEANTAKFNDSLKLIEVEDLKVRVTVEGAEFGNAKRRVRGTFTLNGHQYRLSITDPVAERQYLSGDDGIFDVGKAILCISLGELFNGYAYKLIASVIIPPDDEEE